MIFNGFSLIFNAGLTWFLSFRTYGGDAEMLAGDREQSHESSGPQGEAPSESQAASSAASAYHAADWGGDPRESAWTVPRHGALHGSRWLA